MGPPMAALGYPGKGECVLVQVHVPDRKPPQADVKALNGLRACVEMRPSDKDDGFLARQGVPQ